MSMNVISPQVIHRFTTKVGGMVSKNHMHDVKGRKKVQVCVSGMYNLVSTQIQVCGSNESTVS